MALLLFSRFCQPAARATAILFSLSGREQTITGPVFSWALFRLARSPILRGPERLPIKRIRTRPLRQLPSQLLNQGQPSACQVPPTARPRRERHSRRSPAPRHAPPELSLGDGEEGGEGEGSKDGEEVQQLRQSPMEPGESVRGDAASQQDDVTSDVGSKECEDFHFDTKEMYQFLETMEGLKDDPQCVDCRSEGTAGNLTLQEPNKPRFMMCSGCSQCFCAGSASNEDGPMGHARPHAQSTCHPVALWIDQPDGAYCFQCDHSLSLKPIALAARSHKRGYVVRGMPNCKGRCYVNALVQCLLALDDLWMSMLGPHAPAGSLGLALKELFLETRAGNDAGATLNTDRLLESIHKLDERYRTYDHQDCQEFLAHLRNGLIEEERLKRLPDVHKDVPTVVDSIFKGEVSIMWTYKRCLHTADKDEEFYELSLPLPPKEHPTKSVPAPQRTGRRKRADIRSLFQQIWKEEEKKAAASLPSLKQCLEYYFRKEEVQKRCEICEKPTTSQSKDGGQMVANISESTSLDRAQAEHGHHGEVEEKSKLLSAQDKQNASKLNQDRTKQVELENTAQQVGEDPSKQINMGGPADKTLSLSKLPPVLTIHVLRFNITDKRSGHVKFEENLDVGEYLDPRSADKNNARYRLLGVIEHSGRTATGGHFVAYVRGSRIVSEQEPSRSSSSWFRANDKRIREVSLDEVLKCEAFLLFYEKIEA